MKNLISKHCTLLAIVTYGLMSMPLHANANTTVCTEGDAIICVTETYDTLRSTSYGSDHSYYTLTNNTDERIFSFGVTNTSGEDAYLAKEYAGAWRVVTLNQTEWDAGDILFGSVDSSGQSQADWITGETSENGEPALGSFAKLFGESTNENGEELFVNYYWNTQNFYMLDPGATLGQNYSGSNWVTQGQFYFQGLPESNATFFNRTGDVVASTLASATDPSFGQTPAFTAPPEISVTSTINVAAVPEPQTYWMLLAGLGLIRLSRKYHQQS